MLAIHISLMVNKILKTTGKAYMDINSIYNIQLDELKLI